MTQLDDNKTDRPRSWVLGADVLRILVVWHEAVGKPDAGRLFAEVPDSAWEKGS